MRTDLAFENHMWAALRQSADTLPDKARPYAALLVEAETGLHPDFRRRLKAELLRHGQHPLADRHGAPLRALAANRGGDAGEAARHWGDVDAWGERNDALAAMSWMAGLPDLLKRSAERAPER